MSDLRVLEIAAAAAELADSAEAGRGFLGLDPVTQNEPLLAAELARMSAGVCRADDALVGFAPNPGQPRQMFLASTSARPEPVTSLLGFLLTYCRSDSYLAMVPAGHPSAAAFESCRFTRIGTLRGHWYQSGEYRDITVYFAKAAVECPS